MCCIRFSLLLTLCYISPSTLDDSGLRRAKKNRETRKPPGTCSVRKLVERLPAKKLPRQHHPQCEQPYERSRCNDRFHPSRLPQNLVPMTHSTHWCYILFSIVLTLCYIREFPHHCSLRDHQARNLIASSLWDGTIPGLAEDGKGQKEAGRPSGLPASLIPVVACLGQGLTSRQTTGFRNERVT